MAIGLVSIAAPEAWVITDALGTMPRSSVGVVAAVPLEAFFSVTMTLAFPDKDESGIHLRPRGRAAEQRDELAALHSITASAATSSLSGTVMPSILAVEALMTNSNLLDCTTGNSEGIAPLRMRPA